MTNDPNNQLGFTQEQIVHLQSQIPEALEKAQLLFINNVLTAIDQATGLDLEKFTQDALSHITYTGNLAADLWNYYVGTNTTANNAWNNWVQTLEQTSQATVADFTAWLNTNQANLATLQSEEQAKNAALQTFLQSALATIEAGGGWNTVWSGIESEWETYTTTISGLNNAEIFTIKQFFNSLLGINTSTGQIPGTTIGSSTGLSSLQADWNQWTSNLQTTWNKLFGITTPPASGNQVQATSIQSSTGGASLQADWNTWTTNLQSTWNSFWNGIFGTSATGKTASDVQTAAASVSSTATTASTNASTAIANASTAQTTANNGTAWVTRLTDDLRITSDVFHVTYQVGSSGDAPGTLGTNGKPTWYSAWNDLLALSGVVHSTTAPTDAAPTTGSVIQANTAAATTAGTNASLAIANAQSITDTVINSQTGTSATGQPISSITTALTAIPASNVIGTTSAAVTWGATGTGYLNSSNSDPKSGSETHSPATGDGYVLVEIAYYGYSGNTYSSSVTYNSVAMTKLASVGSAANAAGQAAYAEVWALKSPPTGAKTVAATVTATGSGTFGCLQIISVSYAAAKIGAVNTFTGAGGTTFSMSQASSTNKMVFGAFATSCSIGQTVTFTTSGGQTQRYNQNGTGTGGGFAVCAGDAPGASSVTFSGTSSQTISGWCGITVELSN